MSLFPLVKTFIERLPQPVGSIIARVPYSVRPGLGPKYRQLQKCLGQVETWSNPEKETFVVDQIRAVTTHARNHIQFYRTLFEENNFDPADIRNLADFTKVPIVNKQDLQAWDLESRSSPHPKRYLVNTGGSSGSPLSFYIQSDFVGIEWAHMHTIWAKLGYKQSDLKLAFGGRNLRDLPIAYDALRHHYAVNIYKPFEEIAESLKKILATHTIPYLHGYPSAIYDFAFYCEKHDPQLQDMLGNQLRGAFLGSEFPAPVYRDKIEQVFDIPSVSWYGHTERSVLAWEKEEKYVYHPFISYGYAEAVKDNDNDRYKLVATSYYNFASPFIRYDTDDEIIPVQEEEGILKSFRVAAGRQGEYISDKSGKRIPLTGLIFGRHHDIFADAKFIQLKQDAPGRATILVCIDRNKVRSTKDLENRFDFEGVDIDFDFEIINTPIRTESGKVKLKLASSTDQP